MRLRLTVFLGLILLLAAGARRVEADHADDQKDQINQIAALIRDGVSEDVIVKEIQASGFIFDLAADDILDLRDLGFSDGVIEAMLDTAIDAARNSRRDAGDSYSSGYGSGWYAPRSDGYFNLSVGYFSPWYYYPYAWGFYYDPFPVYYSLFYYPFRSGNPWGYYGYCHNSWYRHSWGRHRFDNPNLFPGTRWSAGDAIRVKRPPVPRFEQAIAPQGTRPRGRLAVSPPEPVSRSRQASVPPNAGPRGRLEASPPEPTERRRIYRHESPEDRRLWRERPRHADLAPRPVPPAARAADAPALPPARRLGPPRVFLPGSSPPAAQPPRQREFEPAAGRARDVRAPMMRAPVGRPETRGATPARAPSGRTRER